MNLVGQNGISDITNLLLYVITPLVIINSYCVPYEIEKAKKLILSLILSAMIHLLFIVIAHIFYKKNSIAQNAVILSNSGFMGIPLIMSTLGEEAVFYLAAYMVINCLVQWTYGVNLMDRNAKMSFKKIILSPVTIALAIGLAIFFIQIPLPDQVMTFLGQIKNLNSPLAMIVLGSYLTQLNFTQIRQDIKRIAPPVFLRLIIAPLTCLSFLCFLPEAYNDIRLIHLILTASPTAISVALFSSKYQKILYMQ